VELLFALLAVLVLRYLRGRGSAGSASGADSSSPTSALGTDAADYGPIDTLTDAWARFEGFYQQGSVAQRDNNPVNVKGNWPGVVGHTSSGIAIFDDVGDGWDAARAWVDEQETEHPDWSISQLFGKVLGNLDGTPVDNDQGNSQNEANYVANYLGVPVGTSVADYTGGY
jgi:hypothetical protein